MELSGQQVEERVLCTVTEVEETFPQSIPGNLLLAQTIRQLRLRQVARFDAQFAQAQPIRSVIHDDPCDAASPVREV